MGEKVKREALAKAKAGGKAKAKAKQRGKKGRGGKDEDWGDDEEAEKMAVAIAGAVGGYQATAKGKTQPRPKKLVAESSDDLAPKAKAKARGFAGLLKSDSES